jgi:hypothetical protein
MPRRRQGARSPHEFHRRPPLCRPEQAARVIEIAKAIEPVQDGGIHIEKINVPFLYRERSSPAEYGAGIMLAIERGWLSMHESGTFVSLPEPDPNSSL